MFFSPSPGQPEPNKPDREMEEFSVVAEFCELLCRSDPSLVVPFAKNICIAKRSNGSLDPLRESVHLMLDHVDVQIVNGVLDFLLAFRDHRLLDPPLIDRVREIYQVGPSVEQQSRAELVLSVSGSLNDEDRKIVKQRLFESEPSDIGLHLMSLTIHGNDKDLPAIVRAQLTSENTAAKEGAIDGLHFAFAHSQDDAIRRYGDILPLLAELALSGESELELDAEIALVMFLVTNKVGPQIPYISSLAVEHSRDSSPELRMRSLRFIGECYRYEVPALDALRVVMRGLNDSDGAVRIQAADTLYTMKVHGELALNKVALHMTRSLRTADQGAQKELAMELFVALSKLQYELCGHYDDLNERLPVTQLYEELASVLFETRGGGLKSIDLPTVKVRLLKFRESLKQALKQIV